MRNASNRSLTRMVLACVVIAAGCGSEAQDGGDVPAEPAPAPSATTMPTTPPSTICHATAVIHLASPVADARARKPLAITVDLGDGGGMRGAHPLTVSLTKDGTNVAKLFDDARETGSVSIALDPATTSALATGRYAIDASAGCPSGATEATKAAATAPLFLVRLGVKSIDVQSGDGERVPLMFHALNHAYDNAYPIGDKVAATLDGPAPPADGGAVTEADLDDVSGKLRVFAAPWATLDTPPIDADGNVIERGVTLPVSLRVGTKPDLVFEIAKTAAASAAGTTQTTGLELADAPAVRLVVDGAPAGSSPDTNASARIAPGEKATVRLAQSPVPAIARVDAVVKWHFEARSTDAANAGPTTPGAGAGAGAGTWVLVPGADESATLRVYGVLGNAQGTAAPDLPWVAVVDDATAAIAGGASDAAGARSILVRHVYEELGLTYDRVSGASHYTSYPGGNTYAHATFVLAHFLARDLGDVVNCSDCASILSTYANMIGADLQYVIIGFNFTLHPIQGIGSAAFGSPFDSGRLAFTYHAVTSADSAATIYDATLAVDGDAAPADAPYLKKLVQGMPGAEYLDRLSGDSHAVYTYMDKGTSVGF